MKNCGVGWENVLDLCHNYKSTCCHVTSIKASLTRQPMKTQCLVFIPAPGIMSITCQWPELIVWICIVQVVVVGMVKHRLYSVSDERNSQRKSLARLRINCRCNNVWTRTRRLVQTKQPYKVVSFNTVQI